jgi:hypothetical protein
MTGLQKSSLKKQSDPAKTNLHDARNSILSIKKLETEKPSKGFKDQHLDYNNMKNSFRKDNLSANRT